MYLCEKKITYLALNFKVQICYNLYWSDLGLVRSEQITSQTRNSLFYKQIISGDILSPEKKITNICKKVKNRCTIPAQSRTAEFPVANLLRRLCYHGDDGGEVRVEV